MSIFNSVSFDDLFWLAESFFAFMGLPLQLIQWVSAMYGLLKTKWNAFPLSARGMLVLPSRRRVDVFAYTAMFSFVWAVCIHFCPRLHHWNQPCQFPLRFLLRVQVVHLVPPLLVPVQNQTLVHLGRQQST